LRTGPVSHSFAAAMRSGLRYAAPIAFGYVPVGFAYGVLAMKVGFSASNTLLMSLIVFAGSAQFIAVGLLSSGAVVLTVIMTTFVVNLRHLLMAAALSPDVRTWPRRLLALFAFQLTDETFAVHCARFSSGDREQRTSFVINLIAQTSWVLGTGLGVFASGLISDIHPLGLDFALPAMFIALLLGQIQTRAHLLVACAAGGISLSVALLGYDQMNVILATVAAATLGTMVERWIRR
jgi:4-azaleucine resistance transporter AzlC